MKKLLAVIGVLVAGVVAEPNGPYPPSGFRPSGPAFELPQENTQQRQEYLPPIKNVDPRRPVTPNTEYGIPEEEEDVSVQGLPTQEQLPIFQYQLQQQKYREFERQRQLDAAQARARPNPQVPRQFAQTTPSTTESTYSTRNPDDFRTEATTPAIELNEGETLDDSRQEDKKEKVTVEVTKQNIQEYPGELFLSSLAQLQLQPQFVPIQQFGQLNARLQYQPIQAAPQTQGYDAATHFAALPSVLAQRQSIQPQLQQQGFVQNPALLVASQDPSVAALIQAQQPNQYQPLVSNQYGPSQVQTIPQPIIVQQPQPNFVQAQQPQNDEARQGQDDQNQFVYQQSYQPQEVIYQPQFPQPAQPQNNYQTPEQQNFFLPQAQLVNYPQLVQQYQNGFIPQQIPEQQQLVQGQDSLQSGIDLNPGNDVEGSDKDIDEENPDDRSTATAVATAFGTRTQPRVMTRYGAPIPRVAASPQTTTESAIQDEQATENAGAVAEANAFAGQRKLAKQRIRKVRPIFTLDRSGHLVLAQEQN